MDKKSSGGINLLGVLQIIFIVLKCVGVIDWSWWKVFVPLWVDLALTVLAIICLCIYDLLDD